MKAMISHKFNGLTGLSQERVAQPQPAGDELRINVTACGLNFADLLMLEGRYQQMPEPPFAPGAEVCGYVDAIGPGTDPDWVGKRVVAYCGHGGLAEQVAVPASACVAAPAALSDAEAAAMPVAYGSAEMALAHRARLKPGEALLVSGAGGGVGLTGVEIGALMGARVIALARGNAKQQAALAKGAVSVFDPDAYDDDGLKTRLFEETDGHGIDVIYDPVGGPLLRRVMRAAAFEARIMPIGFASGEVPELKANHLLVKNVDIIGFWWGAYFQKAPKVMAESLARLMDWAQQGRIAPLVSETFPLDRAVEALELIRDRRATGKIVVEIQAA